eukprot:jgi/Chrpa1/10617/Chrysochromulina_OHIO_Genome00020316-RA
MKSAIAARADVDPSVVMVTVMSGSVIVGVRVLTPTVMATSVQSAMASATSSPSSATTMLASVSGISITVLAVVTPPTVANVQPSPLPPPLPPPQRPPGALDSAEGALNSTAGGAINILVTATASLEGESHAFEAQGASRSIGGPAPIVMPHLGEDFIGSLLQEHVQEATSTSSLKPS